MDAWLLLHVGSAFWFVAGLAGRDVTLARARRATDLPTIDALCATAHVFDRWCVTPGSLAVFVFGLALALAGGYDLGEEGWMTLSLVLYLSVGVLVPLVYLPKGTALASALDDAAAVGDPTPALRAAMTDRTLLATRWYERIVVAVIIVLMITKPF